jgi:dihydroorotate dehydrogenase electron transfer subunit
MSQRFQSRLPKTYPVKAVKEETTNVKTFVFPVSFGARPGQFLMVWIPGVDEVPMSVALDDGEETRITVAAVGSATKALSKLQKGDLVGLRGPYGTYYTWKKGQHLLLVAGGYGVAPMYFTAVEAVKDGCTVDFIIGVRGKEHLLYVDEVKKLKNTTLHIATDDGSVGHKGYNTEVLEELLIANSYQLKALSVFACGPELMMKRVSEICAERDVACAMSLERYMKCGMGLCGSCIMDPIGICLCREGPVVRNEIIQRLTEFGSYHRDAEGKKHML